MNKKLKNNRPSIKKDYQTVNVLTLEDFVKTVATATKPNGDRKKISLRKRQWLNMIEAGKLTCPETSHVVDHCRLDYKESSDSLHYNFYSKCGEMFTVDHIIPISKNGHKIHVDNLQPMIDFANFTKSDSLPTEGGRLKDE